MYTRFEIGLFTQSDFSGGSMKRLKHRSAQPGASDHAGRKGASPLRSVLASLCAVAMSLGMASASVAAFADDRQPTADAAETGASAVDETAENNAVENEPILTLPGHYPSLPMTAELRQKGAALLRVVPGTISPPSVG